MLSLRNLSRAAPRTVRAFSSQCARANVRTALQRPAALVRPSSCSTTMLFRSAFSTSEKQRASELQVPTESQVNEELVAKIESELSMEREMRDPDAFPEHLKDYIENSPFQIQDTLGKEEVTMIRKYGDETIKVTFSIDDLNNVSEDPDALQDENAMMDEMDDASDMPDSEAGGLGSKGAINQGKMRRDFGVTSEDRISSADGTELIDEEADQDPEPEASFPSHCYITVERPGKGTLQIEAVAEGGMMSVQNVYFYRDGKLADPKTRSDEEAARDLYTGPPFGNLDEDLQLLFDKYLEERGINTTLALFVPEYIDYKEQKEYLNWLSGIKSFVE